MPRLFACVAGILLALRALGACAGELIAFSLPRAETSLKSGVKAADALRRIDGMTRVIGAVIDESGGVLIVGERGAPGEPNVELDDLVVALRSRLVFGQWPLVSIDRTDETATTRRQTVRFEGGAMSTTAFGQALLAADVVLKKLALNMLSAEVWGVPSYFALCSRAASEGRLDDVVSARFWFHPLDSSHVVVRDGVAVVQNFRLGVRTEVFGLNGKTPEKGTRDPLGEKFAAALTSRMADASSYFPELVRMQRLFEMVALARGLELQKTPPSLDYWLRDYRPAAIEVPATYPLLSRSEEVAVKGGKRTLEIDGGVELKAIAIRLQDGDVTALRELVLRSRPSSTALSWTVPATASREQGIGVQIAPDGSAIEKLADRLPSSDRPGTSITRFLDKPVSVRVASMTSPSAGRPPGLSTSALHSPLSPAVHRMPDVPLRLGDRLPVAMPTAKVGGVLLSGAAKIDGSTRADLSSGGFGLIIVGETARLAPDAYRRFVTALWATYFSEQPPGVSIDPIAPGVSRHLVRYIGNVFNTDLARVMREADYLAKRAVIGDTKLDVPGFRDADDLRHAMRAHAVGISRRIWFTQQDIRFRRAGSSLLLAGGRMKLDTEMLAPGLRGQAAPGDRAFANFFTRNYDAIAQAHPIYAELFEYARLVSLAALVKDRQTPLLGFLLANKDLVLTENSPGTVQALSRNSRHLPEVTIEGGVDLRSRPQYIFDAGTAQAFSEAMARAAVGRGDSHPGSGSGPGRSPTADAAVPNESVSFGTAQRPYTAIPDHLLLHGEDRRGVRFQTDLALRAGGKPGLELVRSFDAREATGEFGPGWRILLPYRLQRNGDATVDFRNVRIPKRMVLENVLTGARHVLTFSDSRYAYAGYLPDAGINSEFVGLFLLANGAFRLADKLGGEYEFDAQMRLTKLIVTNEYAVRLDYLDDMVPARPGFPLRMETLSNRVVEWRGLRLPERLRVTGYPAGGEQELRFTAESGRIGYVPLSPGPIRFAPLMTNGAVRLEDAQGQHLLIRNDGTLLGIVPSGARPLVSAVQVGEQKADLDYEIDEHLRLRVSRARLSGGSVAPGTVQYAYDESGRLARVAGQQQIALAPATAKR